jgi:hypothetical protein
MELGVLRCQGWLRKHVEKSKHLQLKVFPVRYIVLDRTSGELEVFKKVADTLITNFKTNVILSCTAIPGEQEDAPI